MDAKFKSDSFTELSEKHVTKPLFYFIVYLSIIVLEFRRVENSLNTEFYRKH